MHKLPGCPLQWANRELNLSDFGFTLTGALCVQLVSPVGPTLLKVIVGSNVTLAVSLSVTSDTLVTWKMGSVTVGTWTVNSSAAPNIAPGSRDVLKIEKDGSLTFVNVPLSYSSDYTIKLTILDKEDASTNFTLKVFGEYLVFQCAVMFGK